MIIKRTHIIFFFELEKGLIFVLQLILLSKRNFFFRRGQHVDSGISKFREELILVGDKRRLERMKLFFWEVSNRGFRDQDFLEKSFMLTP